MSKFLTREQFDETFKVGDLFTTKNDVLKGLPPMRYVEDVDDMFYAICTENPKRILLAKKDGFIIHKIIRQ